MIGRRLNESEKKELKRIFDENGFDILDIEELAFLLEEQGATYIGDRDDIVDQWCELMDIRCQRIYLDEDKIIEDDNDWEELSNSKYLNIYRLFEDDDITNRLELKDLIRRQ